MTELLKLQANTKTMRHGEKFRGTNKELPPRVLNVTRLIKLKAPRENKEIKHTKPTFEQIDQAVPTSLDYIDNSLLVSKTLEYQINDIRNKNSYFKTDTLMMKLNNGTKDDHAWNEASLKIQTVSKQNDTLDSLRHRIIYEKKHTINQILLEFMTYDLKDLLGNYVFRKYVSDDETHFNDIIARMTNLKVDKERITNVLKDMLTTTTFMIWPVKKTDTSTLLFYMLLHVLWAIECIVKKQDYTEEEFDFNSRNLSDVTTYVIKLLNTKLDLNLVDITAARIGYEKIREKRKMDIMDFYQDMEESGQKMMKKAVKGGLLDIDDLMMKKALKNIQDGYDSKDDDDD
jgi:hypothetical protein